jgi:uncharacterized membrane protein YbhN (UPF0104 family)
MTWKKLAQVSIILLSAVLLFYFVEFGQFFELIGALSLEMIVVIIFITLLRPLISAYRCVIAHAKIKPIGLKDATKGYFISAFASVLLPSTIGGDVLRIEHMSRVSGNSRSESLGVAAAERICGLLSLMIIFLFLSIYIPNSLGYDKLVLTAIVFIVMSLLVMIIVIRRFSSHLPKQLKFALESILSIGSPSVIANVMAVSLIFQALGILVPMLVAREIGSGEEVLAIALITPLTWLITTIPTTIGGFGVREASFVGLGTVMGIDTELSLLCGLSLSVSMLMTGAIGSLFSADFKKHSNKIIYSDSEE